MKDSRIHIVHIIPTLAFGGAERCVVDLVNHIDGRYFYCTIISLVNYIPLAEEITNPAVKVIVAHKKGKLSLDLFKTLRQLLTHLRPDIVHTHMFSADVWGRIVAKKLHLPVVTTEHNMNDAEGWFKNSVIKKYLRNYSDWYVACSESVKEYAVKRYGISKPFEVIYCGIDVDRFKDLPALNFSQDEEVRLLILGRLMEQKGHVYLLKALAQMKFTRWGLDVVGTGELEPTLKKLVQELGLEKKVTFLPPTHDVPGLFSKTDFLIIPSIWEGLGIIALEGMASGRVVVASRVGGLKEIIKDKQTGFFFEPQNVDSIKNTLDWCFGHLLNCQEVALEAKNYARQHFTVGEMVRKYEEVYKKVLGRK